MIPFNPCPCINNKRSLAPQVYQVSEHGREQAGFYALCTICTREVYAQTEGNLADFWNRSSQDIKATYAANAR